MHNLNKRILITAGPTWLPIDSVRVISNIATGETGIILAEELGNAGCRVTLLLGPIGNYQNKKIRILRFSFFEEFKKILTNELKAGRYAALIHSAAVSDYAPAKLYKRKIKSGIKGLRLRLRPTQKLIDLIKKIDKHIFLVGFKFESAGNRSLLISQAQRLFKQANCDLVVANTFNKEKYRAFILDRNKNILAKAKSKKAMVGKLVSILLHVAGHSWHVKNRKQLRSNVRRVT